MAVTIHHGPYTTIPTNTSPGLQFLKSFLPALDCLDPISKPVAPFLHPDAPIYVGSNPPSTGRNVVPLLEVRSKHLSAFHHDMEVAWDIVPDGSDGHTRTVMFQATSVTVFRNDPDQFAVRVEEFNVLELKKILRELGPGQELEEQLEFQVVEMRTYFDARPVQDRAANLHRESAFGGT
ncbi:uncharacterized protein EURHEDRAFT_414847 [Aspergillus ruber CBS 135680]|uniref:Uncharacterized protein n=1 Tax=Aspergillus ruber (strain CBS 135680) TaxID=1388766 RepID=A0A017S7S8_ASPRC|nr:uncharacterized protein EURHEDRAFT_414847 [Aspergillus ruber CBS 135680]EYE92901.1 hypothetical protein EURHEDRAFT_414847 [Aspergillus ruber CBS 135680]